MSIMQNFSLSRVFTQVNVGGITILGTVIIGGMIWITRSNVKFRIQGSRRVSSLKMIRDFASGAKLDFNFMTYSPVNM